MKIFKRFWPAGILILLLVILGLPHFRRLIVLGPEYTTLLIGIPEIIPTGLEETYAYATLANRVRFNQPINDPYVWEYRDYVSPFLSELAPAVILGNLAKLTGLPLAFVFFKILGPIILIFLFREISRRAGYSQWLSVTAAVAAVFIPKLFALFPYPAIFTYLSKSSDLEFQRLFHPLFSWMVVAASIVFLQDGLSFKWDFPKTFISGLFLGLLFYTYIFAWTWVWFAIFVLAVTMILKKEDKFLKRLIMVAIIGAAVGLPYFLNLLKFTGTALSQDFIARTIMPIRQSYFLPIVRYILLLLFLIFLDRQWIHKIQRRILLILLVVAALLPETSQLVLGYNLEADHWIERFLYPLSTLLFVLVFGNWLFRRLKIFGGIFLVGISLMVFIRLIAALRFELPLPILVFHLGNERRQVYGWMNNNLPKNSIIGGLSFTEQIYLAAYTPFYPYLPRAERTLATTEEVFLRYVFITNLLDVSSTYFDRTLSTPPERIPMLPNIPSADQNAFSPLFGIRYLYDREVQYVEHLALRERAKAMIVGQPQPVGRLDYILVGPTEMTFSDKNFNDCCQLIYENSKYKLYRYNL